MERKFTDGDIIKALDEISHNENLKQYSGIPDTAKHALDLINRQNAEIEELEAKIDKQYEQAKADILGNMSDGGTSCHWCIDQHRAEAIKEFAERLKDKRKQAFSITGDDWYEIDTHIINNLVKEMTEERNGRIQ